MSSSENTAENLDWVLVQSSPRKRKRRRHKKHNKDTNSDEQRHEMYNVNSTDEKF